MRRVEEEENMETDAEREFIENQPRISRKITRTPPEAMTTEMKTDNAAQYRGQSTYIHGKIGSEESLEKKTKIMAKP